MNETIVLICNQAIPSTKIGSWTNRLTQLVSNHTLFDYILSPSKTLEISCYCKKRKFLTWNKRLRPLMLKYWVGYDYVNVVKKISKQSQTLKVVIIDDVHLLEAIIKCKRDFNCSINVIFSFHGYEFQFSKTYSKDIDKILFLSELGLQISKQNMGVHFPKAEVVGNGVDSEVFFPLNDAEKENLRLEKGYLEDDEILIWVANDRPKKGIQIFFKVITELLERIPNLKIIIIGSLQIYKHPNVNNVGKLTNIEVAKYLQISNYYMFTTLYEEGFGLSLIEAYKCGNAVISTNRGAIPEVLHDLSFSYLVDEPHDINSWVDTFEKLRKETNFGKERINKVTANGIWNYGDWEKRFINSINS
ncbi:MAG: hypothetical protein BM564_09995 [Bacteroidetes bacterium MedPE-SWsnd-G2]|nr:MAG: hypothetical protein BM564_09995 [Bacteroidetes bacterium MedPE-SWsnd-G2]